MTTSKIVILGANGQLGRALQVEFPEAHALGRANLDITNADAIQDFDWSSVETVINAAAYTNVDGAELADGREDSWAANATGPAALAETATRHGFTLVHVSSEYVFDGTVNEPITEIEPLAPLSVYGASKAAGDLAVAVAPKHYIVRTSWVIGNGKNFVRTMAGLAGRGVKPSVVDDQIGRLTFANELARGIRHLLMVEAPHGTYNLTGDGNPVSWAEIAQAVYAGIGADPADITGVSSTDYFADKPDAASRPLYSVLALDKIKATGFVPEKWQDGLSTYLSRHAA